MKHLPLTRRAWAAALAALSRAPAQTPASPAAEIDQARERLLRSAEELRKTAPLTAAEEPAFRFQA